METGKRIRTARIAAGMTQAELAKKLGIPYQSIGQWERGARKPKISTIQKIADALSCLPEYLIGESEFMTSEDFQREWQALQDARDQAFQQVHLYVVEQENLYKAIETMSNDEFVQRLKALEEKKAIAQQVAQEASIRVCVFAEQQIGIDGTIYSKTMEEIKMESGDFIRMTDAFYHLNPDGQQVAAERVEELTEIPKYQRKEPDEPDNS